VKQSKKYQTVFTRISHALSEEVIAKPSGFAGNAGASTHYPGKGGRDSRAPRGFAITSEVSGFTLQELLIATAIIAIIAAFAAPNFVRIQKGWALWGSARMVETSLQWGRMRAIASNSPVLFEVDEDGRRIIWRDPANGDIFAASERFMIGGSRIVSAPRTPLRFYPRGNAVPSGTYRIEGETGSYSVIVAPGGRIRFQKN
jgi:prepilin-type N-terminal cleavage/methylation domain-containing protein